MITENYKDGKLITLSKAFDNRAKILSFTYGLVTLLGFASLFLIIFLSDGTGPAAFLFGLALLIIGLIVAKRAFNKAYLSEKIFVNKTQLQLITKRFTQNQTRTFETGKISNFRHIESPELTRHPLAGDTFDYLGYQTQQKFINEMHGDNKLSFDYEGKTIAFGNDVYSWHFEEMEILFYDVTGKDFRYVDSFEKSYFAKNGDDELAPKDQDTMEP